MTEDSTTKRVAVSKCQKGALSELLASVWLARNGYDVFRNVSAYGPVDIVALNRITGAVVLIDVKTSDRKISNSVLTKDQVRLGVRELRYRSDLDTFEWVESTERVGLCRECNGPLSGRRTAFCSYECERKKQKREYYSKSNRVLSDHDISKRAAEIKRQEPVRNGWIRTGIIINRRYRSGKSIMLDVSDHPIVGSVRIAEHTLVMIEKIGRVIRNDEVVRHMDFDTSNNHPDNLTIATIESSYKPRHIHKGIFDSISRGPAISEALRGNKHLLGHKHSPESREKMSKSKKGISHSAAHNRAVSRALKGRVFSDEHKKNISIGKKNAAVERKLVEEEKKRTENGSGRGLSEASKDDALDLFN